ncbi:MAG: hypothetical protein QJR14_01730 [Bacillota bacterium]|nr:hypothetical protein [Bacillota bacterium]
MIRLSRGRGCAGNRLLSGPWLIPLLLIAAALLLVRPVRTVGVERRELARLPWGSGPGQVGRYRSLDGLWRGPTAVATAPDGTPVILDAANHRLLLGRRGDRGQGQGGGRGDRGLLREWRALALPGAGWYTALAPLPEGWLLADGRSGALLALRPGPDTGTPLPLLAAPGGRELRWRRILLLRGGPQAVTVLASEGGLHFVRRRLWVLEQGALRQVGESGVRGPEAAASALLLSAAPAGRALAVLRGGAPLSRELLLLGGKGGERLFTLDLRSPAEAVDLLGELPGLGWLLWRQAPGRPAAVELRDPRGHLLWSARVAAGPPYLLHPAWLSGESLTLLVPRGEGVTVERWRFTRRWALTWRW